MQHSENHRTHRVGWLRAAVLGANDGIVSTASLLVGVAGAMSMVSFGAVVVEPDRKRTFHQELPG